jgi:hypothetical protein
VGKPDRYTVLAQGALRGVVGAMAMTGMRTLAKGLGVLRETPPEEIAGRGAPRLLRRIPPEHRPEAVQLAHWLQGAAAGAAFGALPTSLRSRFWAGPAYGLAIWLVFEVVLTPLLGLRTAERRAGERVVIAADHVLYGLVVAARPRSV